MATFHGIQVYEILENGNLLNAVYTNSGLLSSGHYYIDNEIARKQFYDNAGVNGHYDCRYIETHTNNVTLCHLEIIKYNETYKFIWSENGTPSWTGIGLMAGNRHIAVSYIKA